MLKRARRISTLAGTEVENLVHDCTVTADRLHLRTWYRQRDGVNRPGDGAAGSNIFGEDLAPRLTGILFTPMGDVTLSWDEDAMQGGVVHYLSTLCNGAPAPAPYQVMEVDWMAALCPAPLRVPAKYPHWQHKEFVYISNFINHICATTGFGLVPAVKIITDGDGSEGFTGDNVIVEARLGPLGFTGAFDHTAADNGVDYCDARQTLADGTANPDLGCFSVPSPMPEGWEFG
ncbi:hypothetical protein RJ527_08780 [Thalassospiraceae bacterium LMO-SO8]|nr:hypothetical protein [Alphaproteobacteria bacterium LMO-S08]WND77825.1 hypothetical protein RJ527_08780 [Thalassospiraceae bacterium LMO-SO8]